MSLDWTSRGFGRVLGFAALNRPRPPAGAGPLPPWSHLSLGLDVARVGPSLAGAHSGCPGGGWRRCRMRQLWFSLGLVPVCLIRRLQPPCTRLVAEPVDLPAWPRACSKPHLRRGSATPDGSLLCRRWIGDGGVCGASAVRDADLDPALETGLRPGRYRDRDRRLDLADGAFHPSRRRCLSSPLPAHRQRGSEWIEGCR